MTVAAAIADPCVLDTIVAVWNGGRPELIEGTHASDYLGHFPPRGRAVAGPAELERLIRDIRGSFADLRVVLDESRVCGDTITARFTARASHTSQFDDLPATGCPLTVLGIATIRFDINGRVSEEWVLTDALGAQRQLTSLH